jgi:mitochondrial fission protein ELM1
MSVNPKTLNSWIVTEGMIGTENQCLGVAEALGITPTVHRITLRQPWKTLSPYIGCEKENTFIPPFEGPWPDLLIASGRKSIAASRFIKRMSEGKTFTVQIQDPRINSKHFDLVAVPEHDPTRGDNVITTVAAANRLTGYKLDAAKTEFAPLFAMLPGPRIAVLLGGKSKAHNMNPDMMRKLGVQLSELPGTPIITASRRTGEAEKKAFLEGLGDKAHFFWDGTGTNPYFGILAWADFILVTADSVSMLGDAATTGKPVYMIEMDGGSRRFDKFHRNLIDKNCVRPFKGALEHWTYSPLADSARIAAEIRQRMNLS